MVRNTSVKISGQIMEVFWALGTKHSIGLFQEKKKEGLRTYIFENPPGTFCFFTLPLEIPDKKELHPWRFHRVVLHPLEMGYTRKTNKRGFEDMEFSGGIEERKYGNSTGKLKKKQNFQRCSKVKTHVKFWWVLVFHLGISKRCHTILLNFQRRKLVFTGISKGIVTNLKFPGEVQKIISSTPPIWFFSGIPQFQFPNPRPMEIPHYFFLVTPRNSTSFLINSWKFDMLFLWYPLMEIPYPQPPCLVFFFGIAHLKLSF